MVGCDCGVCLSPDPRDNRFRCSVFLESEGTSVLIDTTPELRQQAIRAGIRRLDAVVYTHEHNDHVIGFDDLRRFCDREEGPLPVHGSADTIKRLKNIFPYAFVDKPQFRGYVQALPVIFEGPFQIGELEFNPVSVPHGSVTTYGFIVGRRGKALAGYFPDCARMTEEAAHRLEGIPILIIDGLRDKKHPTHMTVAEAIEAGQRVRASSTYLTHITHDICHSEREKILPSNVHLAYDGLQLELTP